MSANVECIHSRHVRRSPSSCAVESSSSFGPDPICLAVTVADARTASSRACSRDARARQVAPMRTSVADAERTSASAMDVPRSRKRSTA
eukprot:scaffold12139_cov111-Isochrysis_galbana.AAC.4